LEFQDLKVQLVHLEFREKKEFMANLDLSVNEVPLDPLVKKVHLVHLEFQDLKD
jgi:hypothetical protein